MTRLVAVVLFCLFASPAHAMPCWVIRQAVAKYGEAAVESFARSKGATEAQIEAHRKCLKH